MRKLRRLTEAEVIAEFLRGEFFHKEYDADRDRFASLVENPNLTDATENEIRRILLFRRRDTMWWELPEDRQWWEIEFEPEDVEQVSVFPRAHWRKIARGNFKALDVAARIRQLKELGAKRVRRRRFPTSAPIFPPICRKGWSFSWALTKTDR